MDMASSERVCYVHCNFCNTILAVNVPSNSLYTMVTVRCGHCANLLSVTMGASLQTPSLEDPLKQQLAGGENKSKGSYGGSSSRSDMNSPIFEPAEENEAPRMLPIPPPEKRQRVPSAYNRFIKEEIQRIKANNPDITHREAFSAAAKNWAHFPHIHFGMRLDGSNKRPNQSFS